MPCYKSNTSNYTNISQFVNQTVFNHRRYKKLKYRYDTGKYGKEINMVDKYSNTSTFVYSPRTRILVYIVLYRITRGLVSRVLNIARD